MTALISILNITTLFTLSTSGMAELCLDVLNITMYTEVVIHSMNAMCGVGAKSVAHLMKFHRLQWEVLK